MIIALIIFWISILLTFYSYIIYPGIVYLLSRKKKDVSRERTAEDLPTVSLVVSLYNEEKIIEEKLRNILTIDYPRDKIEFLFGVDGSDDNTIGILRRSDIPGLRVIEFPERKGKAIVLNNLISSAKGDIIVFSDANTMYDPQAVRKLIRGFSDPDIGGVCGELRLSPNVESIGDEGETSYWMYESILKKMESTYRTLFGATGGIYAIRKSLFKQLPSGIVVMDDFLIPIEVVRRGYRVLYEPEALASEDAVGSVSGEFKRKVRIGAANFNGIKYFSDLLNPKYGFISFGLWSHKIIRWFIPFLLLAVIIITIILSAGSVFYTALLIFELVFIVFGILGFVLESRKISISIFSFPYYFIAMNLALFIGFFKSLSGHQKPTWDVIR